MFENYLNDEHSHQQVCHDLPNCFSYQYLKIFSSLSLFFVIPSNSDITQLKKELDDLVDAIIENFFEPEKNKLQPKAD